jgi:hypothetical protein
MTGSRDEAALLASAFALRAAITALPFWHEPAGICEAYCHDILDL